MTTGSRLAGSLWDLNMLLRGSEFIEWLLLTSIPPANSENLEELECRQIWCSPGV